ncbi:hypothetical protein EN785_37135, partial [Mesorhizobium sp. M8A.F.Ca.ET.142.01.1.1]
AARADEDDDGDHDQARDLYERGEIKGLANILDVVRTKAPGDVVAVDLIRKADRWVRIASMCRPVFWSTSCEGDRLKDRNRSFGQLLAASVALRSTS